MLSSVDTVRELRRVHGLQLPLHPLQVSGWVAIAALSAGSFLVAIPALPPSWQAGASAALSALLLVHAASHLGASLVDPAEPELRRTAPRPVPELDRSKHAHAIEDGFCNLCRIRTSGERTKHCGACNKCVERFDHHCKWLNHCVGGRNYATFLMCVSTAVAAAAFVAILAVAELIFHQTETGWFSKPENLTIPIHSSLPSSDAAFLAVVAALGILAAITAGLLLHLCFFHIYISCLGLTTYEYIRQQRPIRQPTQESSPPIQCPSDLIQETPNQRHRPANLFGSRTTVYTCTVIEENVTCAEPTPTPPTTPQDCSDCTAGSNRNAIAPQEATKAKAKVKQKWNCCVSVPDSPDSPLEPRCLMSLCKHKMRKKIPVIEGRSHRTHGHWSSAKLRMLFRVLSNFGTNRSSRQQKTVPAKNNQVVPLAANGNTEKQSQELQQIQTISNLVPIPPDLNQDAPPTPPLPVPQRRRVISETELTSALTVLQQQQQNQQNQQRCVGRRSHYRRRRRSNAHRTKTPALSPIRESGLSNPASPSKNCTLTTGNCTRPY